MVKKPIQIMKNIENQEIGELIAEIEAKDWNMGIDVDDSGSQRRVFVRLWCRIIDREHPQSKLDGMEYEGDTMAEALTHAVNAIRRERGLPTLEEEVSKEIERQTEHEALPPVEIGPGARCRCGSDAPLVIERKMFLRAHWETGNTYFSGDLNAYPAHSLTGLKVPLLPGEIGRCPDCGLWYQLHA